MSRARSDGTVIGSHRPPPGHATLLARACRRQWRRLRHALHPPCVRLVYEPGYERMLSGVPLDPLRADRILAFLSNERLLRREEISVPRPAAMKNILLVHKPEYLESLQQPATLTSILGTPVGEHELEEVLDHQRLMGGGTIQATRIARRMGCVGVNLGGGFHHASAARGMGFCVFNDIAVAIARMRRRGFDERILVVDLDLHDGNGTREIFAGDPTVFTYSIHNESWGDEEAVASLAIALGGGVDDQTYLGTLVKTLPEVVDSFKPGLIIYLAGCDVAADDQIGNWKITPAGMLARDRLVVELARGRGARLVVVLGGGYGDTAWQYSARFLGWLLSGAVVEPPDNDELTLMRFRQIRSGLNPALLIQGESTTGWELTEEDLVGILPGIPRETRFLGFLSKVGVELLLERFGILQQLRTKGFRAPFLQYELDHPLGQTLRILTDAVERKVLVELRVNRNSRLVPGMEVLVVEWMLLQNPGLEFSGERHPLPGQQHPGLGMLREFFGWLMVVCETLELDGIFFYPSKFHLATVSLRHARFLRPEDAATYAALNQAVEGLPLWRASAAVDEGRVVDAASGQPVRWVPAPMVVPVSERLREATSNAEYQRRTHEARAELSFRLAAPLTGSAGSMAENG
ncbi:MAG: histone deacetylase [Acidobacteriota bacterium]